MKEVISFIMQNYMELGLGAVGLLVALGLALRAYSKLMGVIPGDQGEAQAEKAASFLDKVRGLLGKALGRKE